MLTMDRRIAFVYIVQGMGPRKNKRKQRNNINKNSNNKPPPHHSYLNRNKIEFILELNMSDHVLETDFGYPKFHVPTGWFGSDRAKQVISKCVR